MAAEMQSSVNKTMFATIKELITHGRNSRHHQSLEFTCRVHIQRIYNSTSWFVLNCGGGKCMKGLQREGNQWWCVGCEKPVCFPTARFRLHLEVSDSTGSTVIVLFDDNARLLVNTTAAAILTAESGLSSSYNVPLAMNSAPFTPVIVQNPDGTVTSLPSCLQSLVGTTQTFLIPSHTYYDHGVYQTFICKSVLPNETSPLSAGTITRTPPRGQPKPMAIIPTPAKHEHSMTRGYSPDSSPDDNDEWSTS